MKVVWITRINPFAWKEGMFAANLYSNGLITSLAANGVEVALVCQCQGGPNIVSDIPSAVGVKFVEDTSLPRVISVLSHLPADAFASRTAKFAKFVRGAITSDVDAIVIEYFGMGWVLPHIQAQVAELGKKIPLVYVSHNFESQVRPAVAAAYKGNALIRAVVARDARKAAALEHVLVTAAQLVTCITEEDRSSFVAVAPGKTIVTLLFGYSGRTVKDRVISQETPRRVLLMGSLEWIAKQESFRLFLAAAEGPFAAAGIELAVCGIASPKLVEEVMRPSRICKYYGRVPDTGPLLSTSRIGLMPDVVGGGFKGKFLDYIFNGVPVAAIRGQSAGLPFDREKAMILGDTPEELVAGILASIDDLPRLNAMRASAYEGCVYHFDWNSRGVAFRDALQAIC